MTKQRLFMFLHTRQLSCNSNTNRRMDETVSFATYMSHITASAHGTNLEDTW
jgi:hypothetical protein